MRPLKPCTRGLRPLDPFGRCLEKRRTDKPRLQLKPRQASFRAKKKPDGRPQNECIHFRSAARLLLCALRTARPAKLACPETILCVLTAAAGSCLMSKFHNIRSRRGLGCTLHPSGSTRAEPSSCPLLLFSCFSQIQFVFSGLRMILSPGMAEIAAREVSSVRFPSV